MKLPLEFSGADCACQSSTLESKLDRDQPEVETETMALRHVEILAGDNPGAFSVAQ